MKYKVWAAVMDESNKGRTHVTDESKGILTQTDLFWNLAKSFDDQCFLEMSTVLGNAMWLWGVRGRSGISVMSLSKV